MSKPTINQFIPILEQHMFAGVELKQLEDVLYQAGETKVVFVTAAPIRFNYFFGIKAQYLDQAEFGVLILVEDEVALKFPAEFLKEMSFDYDRENERYLVLIEYDEEYDEWFVRTQQGDEGDSRFYVHQYSYGLKSDEMIQLEALGIRHMLDQLLNRDAN